MASPLRDILLNTFERYGGFSGQPAANHLVASTVERLSEPASAEG
jgi:hypothetical protein